VKVKVRVRVRVRVRSGGGNREIGKCRHAEIEKCRNSSSYALRGSGVTKGSESESEEW
jgi:hypothetical protein